MNYSHPVPPRPEFAPKTVAWEAQRVRQFQALVVQLGKWRAGDLEDLRQTAHRISQYIAELAGNVTELPRGYRMTTVGGKRLLSRDGKVFGLAGVPTCLLCTGEQLAQLYRDLASGLLAEIREGSDA